MSLNKFLLLNKTSFRGIAYSWFTSYLYKRSHIFTVNGVNSNELTVVFHKIVCLGNFLS